MTTSRGPAAGRSHGPQVVVAAFDFDGTLTRGGSVFPFLVHVRGLLPVVRAAWRISPRLIRAALLGGKSADDAKELLFERLLGGLSAERVGRLGREFAAKHLEGKIRVDARARLEAHVAAGHRIVIVSASPELYVKEAAARLGADAALATRLEVGGGLLSGRYEGQNCRGAEKFARLTSWLRSEGLLSAGTTPPDLWAYGNSRGDLRLLEAADHGVDAGRLGKLGRLHRFPRLADVPDLT